MPNYSFLSGNMAKPHEGSWFKSKEEKEADKAGKNTYRAAEMARDKASKDRDIKDIEKDFNSVKNPDIKELYGKEYLLKKYKNKGWNTFIDNSYTSTSTYGIDDKNPFISFLDKRGNGQDYPDKVQQAFADYIFDEPREVNNENSWLYANFSNSSKFKPEDQEQYIKVVQILHSPYILKQYTNKSDEDLQPLIAEIESQSTIDEVLEKLKELQDKEPDSSYIRSRDIINKEKPLSTSKKDKIRLKDISIDDIDFTGMDNEDKIKEILSGILKKKDAFANIR